MIATARDMYFAFLDGIKKESTSIVPPPKFSRIINDWGQDEWLKEKAVEIEKNQKRIDDLSKIRVATDGVQQFDGDILYPLAPDTGNEFVFTLPTDPSEAINGRIDDGNVVPQNYPKYLRMLGVMVKIQYGAGQECGLEGISDWKKLNILRSDNRSVTLDNPYRKPKDTRLYYEILDRKLRVITGTTSTPYALRVEYLRYPVQIEFDALNPMAGTPCEFPPQQQKEIVDTAVKVYLERVRDPRYQSFLQEEMIRQRVK